MASTPQPTQQVVCPNCKGDNSLDAQLCQWCGQPLMAQTPILTSRIRPSAQPHQAPPPSAMARRVAPRRLAGLPWWSYALPALFFLCVCGTYTASHFFQPKVAGWIGVDRVLLPALGTPWQGGVIFKREQAP